MCYARAKRLGQFSVATMGLAVIGLPVLAMLALSLCADRFPRLPWPGWSFRWYKQLAQNSELHMSVVRSLAVGIATAATCVIVGFGGGYSLARMKRANGIRALLILTIPAIVPVLLYGLSFASFARAMGFDRNLFAVTIAHIAIYAPVAMGLCFHRCCQLNDELEDAARELGASELTVALSVVIPQIWRTLAASLIVVFVLSWDENVVAWFVSGFDKTYPVYVKNLLESTMSPEVNAVGFVIALGSFGLVAIAIRLLRHRRVADARS